MLKWTVILWLEWIQTCALNMNCEYRVTMAITDLCPGNDEKRMIIIANLFDSMQCPFAFKIVLLGHDSKH